VPQYTSDLVSWAAIGARTTESQTHRQMASGLSMPVGFKNATDGGLQVALDAMVSARHSHAFVGIDAEGRTSIVRTTGNPDVHLVLRGGGGRPNYSKADIAYTKVLLEGNEHTREIMIDCSHGNSNKDYRNQAKVFEEVVRQFAAGEKAILGAMLESNLVEGKQDPAKAPLTYGQSITDGCIAWETTEALLRAAHRTLSSPSPKR
jgi:3-deoxy-7-phosphoheptulonate synthase